MNNLAAALLHMGEFEEAAELSRTAFEAREKNLGLEHPDTLTSMNNLANVLRDMGKLKEAAELHRTAFEGNEKILVGLSTPTLWPPCAIWGMSCVTWASWKTLLRCHRTAFEVKEKILGPEHPKTLLSMEDLAIVLLEMGKLKEAAELGSEQI